MKLLFLISVITLQSYTLLADDTLYFAKVNFLYGSKPGKNHKSSEHKRFGGLHGGHVTIQIGNLDYGLVPTTSPVHIFPGKEMKSDFQLIHVNGQRYDDTEKTVTFTIPLKSEQYNQLKQILDAYDQKAPYDYAFFGMRCASTAQDILGQIGVVKPKSRFITIMGTFYPKLLRKRLFRLAETSHFTITKTKGSESRKWEQD